MKKIIMTVMVALSLLVGGLWMYSQSSLHVVAPAEADGGSSAGAD